MANANFEIPGKFRSLNPGNEMFYYGGYSELGGWPDKATAVASIPEVMRPGRTIGIIENIDGKDEIVEYIWHPNNVGDDDLVPKGSALPEALAYTNVTNTFTEPQNFTLIAASGITTSKTPAQIDGAGPSEVPSKEWVEQNASKFQTESFTAVLSGGKSLGKYQSGDTIPAYTDPDVMVKDLGIEAITPSFTNPWTTMTYTNPTTKEIGETLTAYEFAAVAHVGDSDGVIETKIVHEGDQTDPFTDTIVLTSSSKTYYASINYARGTTPKYDALGNEYLPPASTGGWKNSSSVSYRGYPKIFYGATPVVETDSAGVRGLAQSDFITGSATRKLDTGKTHKIFQFWLPNTVTLQDVTDSATKAPVIDSYTPSALTISDGGSGTIAGTLYTMTPSTPYSSARFHEIQFTT